MKWITKKLRRLREKAIKKGMPLLSEDEIVEGKPGVLHGESKNMTIREKLADYAHNAWSGWMKYLFEKSIPYKPGEIQAEEGALIIPKWAVDRWKSQMMERYKDLPEKKKKTNREEADKILAIMRFENSRIYNTIKKIMQELREGESKRVTSQPPRYDKDFYEFTKWLDKQ